MFTRYVAGAYEDQKLMLGVFEFEVTVSWGLPDVMRGAKLRSTVKAAKAIEHWEPSLQLMIVKYSTKCFEQTKNRDYDKRHLENQINTNKTLQLASFKGKKQIFLP